MTPIQKRLFADLKDTDLAQAALEAALEYLDTVSNREVFPDEGALAGLSHFHYPLPAEGLAASEVLSTLHRYGSPATVAQSGGRYFGFVTGSYTMAGAAAKVLGTFWDQNAALFATSPLAATLETVVEEWLRQLLGLPDKTVAGLVSGSSVANFVALAAARFRQLERMGWNVNEKGLYGAPRLRIVTGVRAHSTVKKALILLGLGLSSIELVPVDGEGRLRPEAMPALDESCILILQAGEVHTGAFDNFAELIPLARAAGAWVHVDGAFGLWAAASSSLAHWTSGVEGANSWAVDGHKTLNTPYDCGIVLCADRPALVSALHLDGAYLQLTEDRRDNMFYTPEMSRRARAVELWATLSNLGQRGVDEMVTGLHDRAKQLAEALRRLPRLEVLNEVVFNQVLIRGHRDELTQGILADLQSGGICWMGASVWEDRPCIRISVCSWRTTEADIVQTAEAFSDALKRMSSVN